MVSMQARAGRVAAIATAVMVALPSCTTYVRPTTCQPGATGCGGIDDARFCDDVAVEVRGKDCAALGIVQSRHFCVVSPAACLDNQYAVTGRDCQVLRYEAVSDATREECDPGTPIFVNQ